MTSVALVVLDTLRKDAFDDHFDWLPGLRFENAWSTSHWTVPVHASLFTGKYPSELGVYTGSHSLSCPEPTIAERLSEAGHETSAFSANPYVSTVFDFDRGFDAFVGNWRLRAFDPDVFDWNEFITATEGSSPLRYPKALWQCVRDDCETLPSLSFGLKLKLRDLGIGPFTDDGARRARSWVRNRSFDDDEFCFLNLMEAHAPYEPPEAYRTAETPDLDRTAATYGIEPVDPDREGLWTAYEDCVRYLSDRYEEIFERLEGEFDYVITLADHGELFGERGWWGHTYSVAPELVHVPLVVSGPGCEDGVHEAPVSLLDVHRTVAEICGLDVESRGRDLRDRPEDGRCLTQYTGLRPAIYDRIAEGDRAAAENFDEWRYGVAVPEDYYGYEATDEFVERGESALDDPRAELDRLVDELTVREPDEGGEDVADAVKDQLKDLGYA